MKARDVMTAPAVTVGPDIAVADIAALLLERRFSAVPVVDEGGRILGIVSEGDLLQRAEAKTERRRRHWLDMLLNRDIASADFVKTHGTHARDVMTRDVVTVSPDTDLAEIASLLERRRIKRVPVVENGRVVGIVSRANLLHALVSYSQVPSGSPATSDTDIRERLSRVLEQETGIRLDRVNIVVTDGIVHLWGTVKSENQRRALTVAAKSVPGVRGIEDHLHHDTFPGSSGI